MSDSVFDALFSAEQPSVKRMVHKQVAGHRKPRDPKIVHASDLTNERGFCPREFALYRLTGKQPKDEYINTALGMTFDEGMLVQTLFREKWLKGKAYGHWECRWCGNVLEFRPKPPKCPKCQRSHFKYNEISLYSEELGVWGGLDMVLDMGERLLRMVEVKILDKDYWADLKAPHAEHLWRTRLYLKIIATSNSKYADRIDSEVAHLVYKGRMYGKKDEECAKWNDKDRFSNLKEFIIERDDTSLQTIVSKAWALTAFKNYGEGSMPYGICKSGFDTRARQCRVAPECFSTKWPGKIHWRKP